MLATTATMSKMRTNGKGIDESYEELCKHNFCKKINHIINVKDGNILPGNKNINEELNMIKDMWGRHKKKRA